MNVKSALISKLLIPFFHVDAVCFSKIGLFLPVKLSKGCKSLEPQPIWKGLKIKHQARKRLAIMPFEKRENPM